MNDLRGQIFGHLEPIEYLGKSKWLCRCLCGSPNCLKEKIIASYSLIAGRTKSCGAKTTRFKDLTGQHFGDLEVITYIGNKKWLCRCSCGNEKVIHTNTLKTGIGNCGHTLDHGFIDITNQRFGKLVAEKYLGDSKWRCRCDCGKVVDVLGQNLRRTSRSTRSCGCSTDELRVNTMLSKYGDTS